MARNRQKAKQRKAKRRANAAKGGGLAPEAQPAADDALEQSEASEQAESTARETRAEKPAPAKSTPAKAQPKAAKEAKAPREKGRFRTFLRSSWAELRRVQWPDRAQLTLMSSITIGFVFAIGAYLGAIDWVAQKIVDVIVF